MSERTLIETTKGTSVELEPTDFAVVIKSDGSVIQYVPGDPKVQEEGVSLEVASGMASVSSLLSGLVHSLLEAAAKTPE